FVVCCVTLYSLSSVFFLSCSVDRCDLLSFPTRRSSDLIRVAAQFLACTHFALVTWRTTAALSRCRVDLKPTYNWLFCLARVAIGDRKSTRLNSSHVKISYAVFCLKKKTEDSARIVGEF